jgi:serine/threonine protein kinase
MTTDLAERLAPAVADRYRLGDVVGRGGMAVVFRAADLRHDRPVAIKVFTAAVALGGSDRFLREIGFLARLNHPHILPLLDSGSADGLLYYVMPFVDGESLRERMTREPRLATGDPPEELVRFDDPDLPVFRTDIAADRREVYVVVSTFGSGFWRIGVTPGTQLP